ncbi:hypothetical protein M885DRAFT_560978, partial [Pelagophyceae sp. CCMP2097]
MAPPSRDGGAPGAETGGDLHAAWRAQQRNRRRGAWLPARQRPATGAPAPAPPATPEPKARTRRPTTDEAPKARTPAARCLEAAPSEDASAAGEAPGAGRVTGGSAASAARAALAAAAAALGCGVVEGARGALGRLDSYLDPTAALLKEAHGAVSAEMRAGKRQKMTVRLAQKYYAYWRPEKPRVILLAESHVSTTVSATRQHILLPEFAAELREAGYAGPTEFVALVHAFGYGEDALIEPPIGGGGNKGTPQFWQLLAACAQCLEEPDGQTLKDHFKHLTKASADGVSQRVLAKLDLLQKLRASGVWLLDVSIVGWYIPQAAEYKRSAGGDVHRLSKCRPPKACKRPTLALSWELYLKHVVRAAAAQGHLAAVVPVGKEVFAALGHDRILEAVSGCWETPKVHDALPAPNAWV